MMNEISSPQLSGQEEIIRQLREENEFLKQASKMQEDRVLEMKQEHSSSMSQMKETLERYKGEIDLLQKRTKIWQSFFTREFVAVIVGAILLIIFASFLMVSMYNNIKTTEVIANGFFVLLGFFFSQTAKGMPYKEDGTPESTMR